jgi:hypothetical protein
MSPPKMTHARVLKAGLAALGLLLLASQGHAQRPDAPFAGLSGAWHGSGTITMSNGASERIRCRAGYTVSNQGMNLQQDLRCASDSYKFDVTSSVGYADGAIFGTWTETSRNATGSVSGRAGGGSIQANIQGIGFVATLTVNTRGNTQSVAIRPTGTDVSSVTISLAKR